MIRSLFRLLSAGLRRRLPAALLLAAPAFFLMVGGASAQDYPVRPIKLVVPYPPGGSSDFMARMIAQKMSATFKESVVVENRPGASAMIGSGSSLPIGHFLGSTFARNCKMNASVL